MSHKRVNHFCANQKVYAKTFDRLNFFLNDFLADTGNHLNPIKYKDINLGSWLIVEYEDKYYVGIAMEKSDDDRLVQVRCLEKPFGCEDPQNLEKERLLIFYSEDNCSSLQLFQQ